MFFSRKKKNMDGTIVLMHYEGLQGFKQDFPCDVKMDGNGLVFTNDQGSTIGLAYNKIQNIDRMPEINFMGKYHNNPVSTAKMGQKWFYIINYVSSCGDSKYIAFWDVTSKTGKFLDELQTKIIKSEHIEL